jgi:RES domain-containing protein
MPALYLALTIEGMILEMAHGFAHRFDPLTICTHNVDVDDIIDLRTDAGRAAAGIDLAPMACPWAYDVATRKAPGILGHRQAADREGSGWHPDAIVRDGRPARHGKSGLVAMGIHAAP